MRTVRVLPALSRFLKSSSQSIVVLRQLLISDPAAAVLPLEGGQSVLIFAMRNQCSLEVLRMLLRLVADYVHCK